MENQSIFILLGIVVLLALFAVVYVNRKNKRPTDYRTLFIIGLTWIPLGFATDNHAFTIAGLALAISGIVNKDKWKENTFRWSDLTPEEKRVKLVVIGALVLLLLAGLIFYMFQ